jgi:hypothetical protein
MLRYDDNPPMLSPHIESVADVAGDWWVGHTKARCEKAFAFDLAARGISYFLPLVERIKISGGRKRKLKIPLFASYVFFSGDENARYAALTTDRLCAAIPVINREQFVGELASLEVALASNSQLDLYPFAAIGRRCRVRTGPLEGVIGTVIERENHKPRLVLQVSMLGAGAALEIEVDLLEPVD